MAQGTEPLVSVLIPCYNAQAWVADAIRSALDQTWGNKEVIVVDDGSTDRSLEVIRSFAGQIRWATGKNQGSNVARNRLLELSHGEWLQYLDADDYLLPLKIEAQMEVVGSAACDLAVSACPSDRGLRCVPRYHAPWLDFMLTDGALGNNLSNLWRKQAVELAGGWDPAEPVGQEYGLMLRMLKTGVRVAYCPPAMAFYRAVNPESITERHRERRELLQYDRIGDAARHLAALDVLPSGVGVDALGPLLRLAKTLWRKGHPAWRDVDRLVNRIDPDRKVELCRSTRVYGKVYSLFGFGAAERYLQARSSLRRSLNTLRELL